MMLSRIQKFFDDNIASPDNDTTVSAHGSALATAALLSEMVRIDNEVLEIEQAVLTQAICRQFDLTESEAVELASLADEQAKSAGDYYQFTSLINQRFTSLQKIEVLENLWLIAYADLQISAHERHLMRKLADLLHIPHGDHMLAKDRARTKAGL